MEVALTSADLQTLFASTSFVAASNWTHHTAALTADAHDPSAVLVIQAPVNCSLDVDVVSLFPAGNGRLGVKTPFRPDLLNLLKGLHPKCATLQRQSLESCPQCLMETQQGCPVCWICHCVLGRCSRCPCQDSGGKRVQGFSWSATASNISGCGYRFIRLPGGCYVEGTRMSNAYLWKPSVGPLHQRPGHWNGQWQYWSTDGTHLVRLQHVPAQAARRITALGFMRWLESSYLPRFRCTLH